jgi:type I restriction enzyme S subunit
LVSAVPTENEHGKLAREEVGVVALSFEHLEEQVRTYDPLHSAVFWKTREKYGGLSNMAAGYPLNVNGIRVRTSEALYQALRFPSRPDIQNLILSEISPMTAKMRSKPYRESTRADWMDVRIPIMRWCLRLKLFQNWESFGKALRETGDRPIVEKKTKRADFWGAKCTDTDLLVGPNILGRLLMELRSEFADAGSPPSILEPLKIENFCLLGRAIEPIAVQASGAESLL